MPRKASTSRPAADPLGPVRTAARVGYRCSLLPNDLRLVLIVNQADDDLSTPLLATEQRQKAHYDAIAEAYERHAGDPYTLAYRRRFIDEPLLAGVDLEGRDVLEAMCGSGHSTGYLLERGARVTGLDVSPEVIARFREKWPQCRAVCDSILRSDLPDESYDVVVVVGGLHHLERVDEALIEIHRLLRPGGSLCFYEPHTGSLADRIRRRWYPRDSLFEESEAAIDIPLLKKEHADRFRVVRERYVGSVAYILVLNSLILRMPNLVKRLYSPVALWLERVLEPLLTRTFSCAVLSEWRRI
jgi:SAM-dependent methyltransferase